MTFKNYVSEILSTEISIALEKRGYLIEIEFCNMIRGKYNLSIPTVRGTLHRIYPELSLIKRRLSNELKDFYCIKIKGCPVVYIPDSRADNHNGLS